MTAPGSGIARSGRLRRLLARALMVGAQHPTVARIDVDFFDAPAAALLDIEGPDETALLGLDPPFRNVLGVFDMLESDLLSVAELPSLFASLLWQAR